MKRPVDGWHEGDASDSIREAAVRSCGFIRCGRRTPCSWPPRFAAEGRPSSLELVTIDERLTAAARKEGFAMTEAPQID